MIKNDINFENRVLELLNAENSVESFLNRAVFLLEEACDHLISKIFRKDDYAVKYAVDALLGGNGPLAELGVKFKLLYAIGIIVKDEYNDSEYLLSLHSELQSSLDKNITAYESCQKPLYQFLDEEIIAICYQLHCVEIKPPSTQFNLTSQNVLNDPTLQTLQQKRHRQMIKSTLVLSLTSLIKNIYMKPAEKISPVNS